MLRIDEWWVVSMQIDENVDRRSLSGWLVLVSISIDEWMNCIDENRWKCRWRTSFRMIGINIDKWMDCIDRNRWICRWNVFQNGRYQYGWIDGLHRWKSIKSWCDIVQDGRYGWWIGWIDENWWNVDEILLHHLLWYEVRRRYEVRGGSRLEEVQGSSKFKVRVGSGEEEGSRF